MGAAHTDPAEPQQHEQRQVCDECAKRLTWRKMALSFLVQAGVKIVHSVKGLFS